MNICYPLPMVQSLMEKLHGSSGQFDSYYGKSNQEDYKKKIFSAILNIPLHTSAVIGEASLLTKDLLNVSPGMLSFSIAN